MNYSAVVRIVSLNSPFFAALLTTVIALSLLGYLALLDQREPWFAASVIYFILAAIALTLMSGGRTLGASSGLSWQRVGRVALFATLLTALIWSSVGIEFRVLADETNLLATSRTLFTDLALKNVTETLHYYDSESVIHADTAHRPGLFATVTALLHFISGFHWLNAFITNLLVSIVTLSAVVLFFQRTLSLRFGVVAALLLASFPIYQLNITSAGYDALNMLMVMLFYMQLWRFMHRPSGGEMELLLLLALLASYARYESAAVVLVALVAILLHWRQLLQWRYSLLLPLIPLLYLPVVWQKIVSSNFANAGDDPTQAFNLGGIGENWLNMWRYFSDWSGAGLPTHLWIVALALIGGVIFLGWGWRQRSQRRGLLAFGLLLLAQSLISIAHFAYYFGDYQLAWINRLAQIQLLWLVPLATTPLIWLSRSWQGWRQGWLVLGLLFIYLTGNVVARENKVGKSLTLFREYKQVRHYLQQHYPLQGTVVINERSGLYTALGYSAIKPHTLMQRQAILVSNLERGLFQQLLFVSKFDNDKRRLQDKIAPRFEAELLKRLQFDGSRSVDIYRLTVKTK